MEWRHFSSLVAVHNAREKCNKEWGKVGEDFSRGWVSFVQVYMGLAHTNFSGCSTTTAISFCGMLLLRCLYAICKIETLGK